MITVGEILTNARREKKITLEQVEKATKIRPKFLSALEKNDFSALPSGAFTRGFIKNYATFLGLSSDQVLAFYRRQEGKERVLELKNPPTPKPTSRFSINLSPMGIITGLLITGFFLYLIYSYIGFAGNPKLELALPVNNSVTTVEEVEVRGVTDPDSQITVNNQSVSINEKGEFSVKMTLQPGLNTISVTATNKFQRKSTIQRNLRLEKEN